MKLRGLLSWLLFIALVWLPFSAIIALGQEGDPNPETSFSTLIAMAITAMVPVAVAASRSVLEAMPRRFLVLVPPILGAVMAILVELAPGGGSVEIWENTVGQWLGAGLGGAVLGALGVYVRDLHKNLIVRAGERETVRESTARK